MLMIQILYIKISIPFLQQIPRNMEIPKVTEWLNSNTLHIDTNKTAAMLFLLQP